MEFLNQFKSVLGENDFSFLKRVYNSNTDVYINRLKAIGFEGMNTILDAGCGFGQWSLALGKLNESVIAFDAASERVLIAKSIASHLNVTNVKYHRAILEESMVEDEQVDAIFCYGTIFIADPQKSIKEFYRVLKKGGRLYLNANAIGWALNSWFNSPNATKDHDPRSNVPKMFRNTLLFQNGLKKEPGQMIIEKAEMLDMLEKVGFRVIAAQPEGSITLNDNIRPKPFFQGEYFGFDGIYEVLCNK